MTELKKSWEKIKTKYETSKIISSKFVQNFTKVGEWIYLLAIIGFVFNLGMVTTMIRELAGVATIVAWIDFFVIGLLWIKIIIGYAKDFNKLMLAMLALLLIQFVVGKVGDQQLMTISLCILGANEVRFDRVLKGYIFVVLGLLITAFVMSQLGYIENLKYYQGGLDFRYALGGVYPTDTMCHVLFLSLAILYLIKDKLKLWMLIVIGTLNGFVFAYTEGKAGFASIVIALVGCCAVEVLVNKTVNVEKRIVKVINRLMIWSVPLAAGGFTTIVLIYMWKNRFRHKFPISIASRMGFTARAFREYGVPIWGCPISMKGNGGSTKPVGVLDYFFLDCSYMWVLFVYGLVVLLIILGIFVAIGYKFKNDWYMLVILLAIALDCMIEHHLMDMSYNIFILALFARCENCSSQSKDIVNCTS